jgi:hypothetical protein
MTFNPGEPIYVFTSPAWVLLLAASRLILGDVLLALQVLGILCEMILVIALVRFGRESSFGIGAGVFAAIFLVMNPVFVLTSFSGMELSLFLLLIMLTVISLQRSRDVLAVAMASSAIWVRFDGIVVLLVTCLFIIWRRHAELKTLPHRLVMTFLPGFAIVLAYLAFGMFFFDSFIPISVKRKMLTTPDLLSLEWVKGVAVLMKEYAKALIGSSAYWYRGGMVYLLPVILMVAGIRMQWSKRGGIISPISVITAAIAVSYLMSGSAYARNFPWYFAPVLPVAYLYAGVGTMSFSTWISSTLSTRQTARVNGAVQMVVLVIWCALACLPLTENANRLTTEFTYERERAYATAAVWCGNHLPDGALIAANEIGAIGFFLPRDISVLDLFGLLRSDSTIATDGIELVLKDRPECIFTRQHFHWKANIQKAAGDSYSWYKYRTLDIGIRTDLQSRLGRYIDELPQIYHGIDIDSEYDWDATTRSAHR